MNNSKTLLQKTIELIILFAIATISLIILDKFTNIFSDNRNNQSQNQNIENNVDNNVATSTDSSNVEINATSSLMSDFDKFKSYNQVTIYGNDGLETPGNYINNDTISIKNAGRKIKITGQIADAYIYIKAGANDENGKFTSIMKKYDGIWFYLQNGQFLGGQLNLSMSVYGQLSDLTELLYNLKNVPLAKNKDEYRKDNYQTKNLMSELKDNRTIGALVSTERYGKIEQLIIAYKCVENVSCKIELR